MSKKKNSRYREPIGDPFFGLTLYYREYFTFSYTIEDALTMDNLPNILNGKASSKNKKCSI